MRFLFFYRFDATGGKTRDLYLCYPRKRSFLMMRRLKTWLRSTMSQKKLTVFRFYNLIRFFSLKLLMDLLGINQHVKKLFGIFIIVNEINLSLFEE